jgi:hypothetical protein
LAVPDPVEGRELKLVVIGPPSAPTRLHSGNGSTLALAVLRLEQRNLAGAEEMFTEALEIYQQRPEANDPRIAPRRRTSRRRS